MKHRHVLRTAILTLCLVIIGFSPLSGQDKTVTYYQDPASTPPELSVTLKHLDGYVKFKPEENTVMATTVFSFFPNRYRTDSILFYSPGFNVQEAVVSGGDLEKAVSVPFRMNGNQLVLSTMECPLHKGKEYRLRLVYTAAPPAGMIYFVGWTPEENGKRKAIWAHRPHGWLPYMDARITMDMQYTVDGSFKVFANGECESVKTNPDGTKTWRYRLEKDHPYFSTAVVIGDYDYTTSRSSRGVPLEYWYYRGEEAKVPTTYKYTESMMDFLERELGVVYPYPLYRQAPVIDYMYGAMETTTSTVFGDFMLIDRGAFWQRNYINTNVHEMAHQWFGNCIAHLVNKDVWLTESFATYYAKLFERSEFGEDYYQNTRNDEFTLVLNAAKSNNYPVGGSRGGNARIYQKGSLVLDMLRDVMGEAEFRDAVKLFLDRYRFRYAETNDFIRCVYDATGVSYQWFFDEWILRGGEPTYKIAYDILQDTNGNRKTIVHIGQVHETNDLIGLFKMPVDVQVHYNDGTMDSITATVDQKDQDIVLPNPMKKMVEFVVFDPGRRVLKKVIFDRSYEELAAQACRAQSMIDRYDALVALKAYPYEKRRDLLVKLYSKETFHLIRSEILDQLSGGKTDAVLDVFRSALKDADGNVRRTALRSWEPVPFSLKEQYEAALQDTSYANVEIALQALCRSFPDQIPQYLERTKSQTGWRGRNIRMKWLEISISSGNKGDLAELIAYASPVYEFETRMNALTTLKKLLYVDAETVKFAVSASKHWNNKLAAVGKEYLAYFGK